MDSLPDINGVLLPHRNGWYSTELWNPEKAVFTVSEFPHNNCHTEHDPTNDPHNPHVNTLVLKTCRFAPWLVRSPTCHDEGLRGI